MGQYHIPVCVEAEEGLSPSDLGCGLKEGEQGFTRPGTPAALVALVCARGGNMPADCSQSPIVGKWAGKRVLIQGDYAEDTDIPNWDGPPLSLLYRAMENQEERDKLVAYREKIRSEGMDYPSIDFSSVPFYADIGPEVAAFIEAACNVRFFGENWRTFVKVAPTGKQFGNSGVAEYVIDPDFEYSFSDFEYFKGCGMTPLDVQRVPRSGDWHGILPTEVTEGQTRVLVNLDTMEYINPVVFCQVPTLAGMMNATFGDRKIPVLKKVKKENRYLVDVAGALFALLCHPERRGGGDIPANAKEMGDIDIERAKYTTMFKGVEQFKGRWRGGHILGTAEIRYEGWPTTEEVLEKGMDISDMAIKYLAAVSHY
jgi:hypothetical protein